MLYHLFKKRMNNSIGGYSFERAT